MTQQQLFKVRDLRKKDQFKIDDKYLNGYARILGVYSTAVYSSLSRHAEFYSQKAFPSIKLIAKEHNISEKSVQRAIKKLKLANIIEMRKSRTNNGKWLNNTYFLIDKTQWKQPEDLKDLWIPIGLKRPKPEDLKDLATGNQSPIKDNKSIRITNKKDIATKVAVNEIIELFKSINPNYERLFANKTQRSAIERMSKKFGDNKLMKLIKILKKTNKIQYAPSITTPIQLEQKMGNLKIFLQKREEEIKNNKPIIL